MKTHHIPVIDETGRCVCILCGERFTIFRDLSGGQYAVMPLPTTCGTIRTDKTNA